jgi:dihydropteridine reductase
LSLNCRILPGTLDTVNNRKWMASADKSSWTPLGDVVTILEGWIRGERPVSGSLVKLKTEDAKTSIEIVE